MRKIVITVLFLAAPRAALACPVCFGQSDAPLANAMNLGILAMLVVVFGVLSSFAAFIVVLNRRARAAARSEQMEMARRQAPYVSAGPQEGIAQC
jgi:hypothetical protein